MKKICIITQYYPDDKDMIFSFVDQLVCQFADYGCECHVITPVSFIEKEHKMSSRKRITTHGNVINIYCPKYVPVPHRVFWEIDSYKITMRAYYKAVERAFRKYIKTADKIYAHFLNPSGIAAAILSKKTGIPAFVACGESSFDNQRFSFNLYKDEIYNNIEGVIAVSSSIATELKEMRIFPSDSPILVQPNAVDMNEFPRTDINIVRQELNIAQEAFVVSFIGHFIERKGIERLIEAANMSEVWQCIFIGKGNLPIDYERTLFCGTLPHNQLYRYLSASDVFVLPTQAEGCCNAIIEAMACGLPIVSSNLPFNDDILDDEYSIRINPFCTKEIYDAVEKLRNNPKLRNAMSIKAHEKACNMSIGKRANRILNFMLHRG